LSFFDNFLQALSKGDEIRDYQHASRVFRDNDYTLSPKFQFLYYVLFEFNPKVRPYTDFSADTSKTYEVGMLVKSAQLPSFDFEIEEKNQYGRHVNVQTRINYTPVQLVFHDDVSNTINTFWINYYRYYYADASKDINAPDDVAYRYTEEFAANRHGYKGYTQDGLSVEPFLKSIKIYSLHQKQFTEYTLVNPIIRSMQHGTHDSSAADGLLETTMQIGYESVLYGQGYVAPGVPQGMELHYDRTPSTISSGTTSFLGPGGLLDTSAGILSDLGSGNFIGAISKGLSAKSAFENVNIGSVLKEEALETAGKILRQSSTRTKSNGDVSVPVVEKSINSANATGSNPQVSSGSRGSNLISNVSSGVATIYNNTRKTVSGIFNSNGDDV
jgi:hypothetical protein